MVDVPSVKVVGRFGMTAADGVDADDEPDVIWCDSGTVRLEPLNSYTKVAGGSPSPWTAGHSIIEVPLDSEGYLAWSGARYIRVLDLTSPAVNPVIPANKATHSVKFKNVKAGGTTVSFDSVNVRLAADTVDPITGVCDLTKLMPVPTAGGTPIVRGEAGRGIAALDVAGNALVATFTDGSTVETDLPAALVETDAALAGAISNPESLTGAALKAGIAQEVSDPDSPTGMALSTTYAPPAVPLPIPSGGDDYAALQAVLTANAGKRIAGSPGAAYKISDTLKLSSGTTLDMTGCSITITVNNRRMIQNVALGGSGARDTDINLIGGFWDRSIGGGGADGNQTHSIVFHRADRVTVTGVRFHGEGAIKYAIYGVDVNHFRVERCDITSTSDGVHITGPSSDITVRDIAGDTHDDLVSFTGRDYVTYEMTAGGGSLSDITVERITLRSGDGNTVKLLPGQEKVLSGAVVRGVSGNPVNSAVVIYSDTVQAATTGGTVKDVLIDSVSGQPSVAGFMVNVAHPDVENLTVRNIMVSGNASPRVVAFSTAGGVTKRAIVDGITSTVAYTGALVHVGGGYTVQDLKVANASVTSGAGAGVVVQVSGTVNNFQGSNISQVGGRAVLNVDGVGACPLAAFSGLSSSATYGVFVNNAAATVEAQVSNVTALPTSRLAFANAGTLRLRGSGITGAVASHIGKSAGATISATGTDVRADTSTLTPQGGDTVFNTATGEAVGGGRVTYTGAAWVNMQSGASVISAPTYTPGAIPAGGQVEMSSTIVGAAIGDLVRVVPPAGIEAGLVWLAWVSAANTVKVRITNVTGASITPASAAWKILVTK